jgi:hypothetical protein
MTTLLSLVQISYLLSIGALGHHAISGWRRDRRAR